MNSRRPATLRLTSAARLSNRMLPICFVLLPAIAQAQADAAAISPAALRFIARDSWVGNQLIQASAPRWSTPSPAPAPEPAPAPAPAKAVQPAQAAAAAAAAAKSAAAQAAVPVAAPVAPAAPPAPATSPAPAAAKAAVAAAASPAAVRPLAGANSKARCALLGTQLDSVESKARAGGSAADMERFSQERRSVQKSLVDAGC